MTRLAVLASLPTLAAATLPALVPTLSSVAAADGNEAPAVCASCVVVPAPASRPVDLRHRLGVSARVVSLSLDDGTNKTEYGGGGLAVSYRLNRRWEFAVALDALDAPQGRDLHSTSLEARFHLNPFHRWDWYAVAGLGGLHEAPLETESDADMRSRGRVHAGIGLERRFPRWSLAAEIHAVGVGPLEGGEMTTSVMKETPSPMTATETSLSGGEMTLAGSFYF